MLKKEVKNMQATDKNHVAISVISRLAQAGYQALFAGGCVRDRLLQRQPKDYDVATDAPPEAVQALFPHTHAIGKAFGVIQVVHQGETIEVTTFRKDHNYTDGRRPQEVSYTSAQGDAERRDFTINGLFYDPLKGELLDYVDGGADLQRRLIRAIGDPYKRFQEDHLRLIRAIRFASTLGFSIEPKTGAAIKELAGLITTVSAERIQQELTRILLEAQKPGDAVQMLADYGLLAPLLPEVQALIGQEQPPEFHPEGDVFVHTVIMLNNMAYRDKRLAFGVLLHDIGKPPTVVECTEPDGSLRLRFNNHAQVGAAMAVAILERLRFSNRERDDIAFLVDNHMTFKEVQKMRESRLRRLIAAPTFTLELELHRLDCLASHGSLDNYDFLVEWQKKIASEPVLPKPWISGHDVMAICKLQAGPQVGRLLHQAYELQLEGKYKDKEELAQWLRENWQG